MNKLEQQLLATRTNDAELRLSLRTGTYIDAGRWWRRTPLWICLTDDDVIVLAAARRHFVERFPIEECQGSHYCHTTGELVIEAGDDLKFSRLAMSPVDALQVLGLINKTSVETTKI